MFGMFEVSETTRAITLILAGFIALVCAILFVKPVNASTDKKTLELTRFEILEPIVVKAKTNSAIVELELVKGNIIYVYAKPKEDKKNPEQVLYTILGFDQSNIP